MYLVLLTGLSKWSYVLKGLSYKMLSLECNASYENDKISFETKTKNRKELPFTGTFFLLDAFVVSFNKQYFIEEVVLYIQNSFDAKS